MDNWTHGDTNHATVKGGGGHQPGDYTSGEPGNSTPDASPLVGLVPRDRQCNRYDRTSQEDSHERLRKEMNQPPRR